MKQNMIKIIIISLFSLTALNADNLTGNWGFFDIGAFDGEVEPVPIGGNHMVYDKQLFKDMNEVVFVDSFFEEQEVTVDTFTFSFDEDGAIESSKRTSSGGGTGRELYEYGSLTNGVANGLLKSIITYADTKAEKKMVYSYDNERRLIKTEESTDKNGVLELVKKNVFTYDLNQIQQITSTKSGDSWKEKTKQVFSVENNLLVKGTVYINDGTDWKLISTNGISWNEHQMLIKTQSSTKIMQNESNDSLVNTYDNKGNLINSISTLTGKKDSTAYFFEEGKPIKGITYRIISGAAPFVRKSRTFIESGQTEIKTVAGTKSFSSGMQVYNTGTDLTVTVPLSEVPGTELAIYSLKGQLVQKIAGNQEGEAQVYHVDRNLVSSGVYIMGIQTGNGPLFQKLVQ